METVRWGIIGAGDVCEVKSGPAFYKIEHSELVAVMRRDAAKAADFAQRHGARRWYDDADALFRDPEVNAIYVATPPQTHADYAIRAMQAGKAVYVEKPMAMTFGECQAMIAASESTGMPLFVAHYRRSLPYFIKVKSLLDANKLGTIVSVLVRQFRAPLPCDLEARDHTWRVDPSVAGGGYLFDLAPHTIDILDFLLGRIVRVHGFTTNRAGLYAAEDSVTAAFAFESGVVGNALWNFVSSPAADSDRVEIIGTNGSLTFSVFGFTPIVLENGDGAQSFTTEQPQHIQQPFIQTIVDELRGIGQSPCHGETGSRPNWFMEQLVAVSTTT
jgi:predicted dehydrogenase